MEGEVTYKVRESTNRWRTTLDTSWIFCIILNYTEDNSVVLTTSEPTNQQKSSQAFKKMIAEKSSETSVEPEAAEGHRELAVQKYEGLVSQCFSSVISTKQMCCYVSHIPLKKKSLVLCPALCSCVKTQSA